MTIAKLPKGVGADALMSVTFDTAVNPSASGVSGRKSMRLVPIRNYTVSIGPDDAPAVNEIYISMLGERYVLGMRDYTAWSYTDQVLEWTVTETDITTAPLRRKWTAGGRTVYERILIPDEEEVFTTIKINGFSPTSGTSFTIVDPGIIRINRALTPGDVVTASGQNYQAVCFTDDLTATIKGRRDGGSAVYIFGDVRLRQVLEAEYMALTAS